LNSSLQGKYKDQTKATSLMTDVAKSTSLMNCIKKIWLSFLYSKIWRLHNSIYPHKKLLPTFSKPFVHSFGGKM
jgi:hypothetical protein